MQKTPAEMLVGSFKNPAFNDRACLVDTESLRRISYSDMDRETWRNQAFGDAGEVCLGLQKKRAKRASADFERNISHYAGFGDARSAKIRIFEKRNGQRMAWRLQLVYAGAIHKALRPCNSPLSGRSVPADLHFRDNRETQSSCANKLNVLAGRRSNY